MNENNIKNNLTETAMEAVTVFGMALISNAVGSAAGKIVTNITGHDETTEKLALGVNIVTKVGSYLGLCALKDKAETNRLKRTIREYEKVLQRLEEAQAEEA